ncbi:MAG: hypothetical protein IPK91_00065 [Saprospiraceae bacterium]|nr:hypothetical protein [Saprospiraceae bacterium]MBK8295696.1 hypothetical protein [Saprospiraceae bacterium]
MAIQEGLIKLVGNLENLSFYKLKGKYFVRRKTGPSAEHLKTDIKYERCRENMNEFKTVTQFAKKIRVCVRSFLGLDADPDLKNRLVKTLYKVKAHDLIAPRGGRNPINALKTEGGRKSFIGFKFSRPNNSLNHLMDAYSVCVIHNKLHLESLNFHQNFRTLNKIHRVGFQCIELDIDTESGFIESKIMQEQILENKRTSQTLDLNCNLIQSSKHIQLFILKSRQLNALNELSHSNQVVVEVIWISAINGIQ